VRRRKAVISKQCFEKYGTKCHIKFDDEVEKTDDQDDQDDQRCLLARRISKIKDEHNISKQALQQLLGKEGINCPSKAYLVSDFAKSVDEEMMKNIEWTTEDQVTYCNIRQLLEYLIKNVYKETLLRDIQSGKLNKLKIKLSGDGRKSSKRFPFLLLTATILCNGRLNNN